MNVISIIAAYLIPIGFMLVAWGGLPPRRARLAAAHSLMTVSLAITAYIACGFAFQFGGLGLALRAPGYESLRGAYSPLGGDGWSVIGLRGFWLDGGAPTREIAAWFLHHLPLVITAALAPALALSGRARSIVVAAAAVLVAGLAYPLAGNWIVGNGWLAHLGANLQLGHGAVDVAGAGPVYLLGSLIALVGLSVFAPPQATGAAAELPPAHFPLLATAGCILYSLGWMVWLGGHPLHGNDPALNLPLALSNGLAAAAVATLVLQAYSWFTTSRINLLMTARGWLAGWIVVSAGAPFMPVSAAMVLGALAGACVPLGLLVVERVLRREDSTAAAGLGLAGLWGVLAPGIFADGNWGAGWNGVGANEYLTVAGQGVTGLVVRWGFLADPGQFTAQLVELAVIVILSMLVAWGLFGLLRALSNMLSPVQPPTV